MEVKKSLVKKDDALKGYVAIDDAKIYEAYYQGQYGYIASVKSTSPKGRLQP